MKSKRNLQGFTLVELLVTVAIMGIMAAIAMPSMVDFIAKSRIVNRAEQMGNLLRFAKGEAIRMNLPVVVCGDTVRKDGRPTGVCTSDIFANKATNSALKAFADANKNGAYSSSKVNNVEDVDLRTIHINGNAKTAHVHLTLEYCDISGSSCRSAEKPMQLVFFPNGQFGVQKKEGSLSGITVGNTIVRLTLKDTQNMDKKAFWRYVVINSSGSVKVCSDNGSGKPQCNP